MVRQQELSSIFVPGSVFNTAQCEWLMHYMPLRITCKALHLSWQELGMIYLRWLQREGWFDASYTLRGPQDLPVMYHAYKASMLQRCALRAALHFCDGIVAGSYPAAMYMKQQGMDMQWRPSDIDVWVHTDIHFDRLIHIYVHMLKRAGVHIKICHNTTQDYPSDSETVPCKMPRKQYDYHRKPPTAQECAEMILNLRATDETLVSAEVAEMLRSCEASLSHCGQPRRYDIHDVIRIRVDRNHYHARRWWSLFKDLNIIQVSLRNGHWTSETICRDFDLSCCSIAMNIEADLTASYHCHCGAETDLRARQMILLPCSFSNLYRPEMVQLARLEKYIQRDFRLTSRP